MSRENSALASPCLMLVRSISASTPCLALQPVSPARQLESPTLHARAKGPKRPWPLRQRRKKRVLRRRPKASLLNLSYPHELPVGKPCAEQTFQPASSRSLKGERAREVTGLITDQTTDRVPGHGPHWEAGVAKDKHERDPLGRLRVRNGKSKAEYSE